MRSARVGVALLLMAAATAGCAVFASKAEYRLVEQMRSETDPVLRAEALSRWESEHAGDGRMGDRVAKLSDAIDDDYWTYLDNQGLEKRHAEAYLERFPEGGHAEAAQRRLDQLRYFAERDAARREAKRRAEEEERRRVEEENERQRARVRNGLERWLRSALEVPRWGTTLPALLALDESLREQWTGEPAPVCVDDTCRRTIEANYFFARTGGTRIDRSLSLVFQIDMREGRVFQLTAYYTGRGFVDWLEMGSDQPIIDATEEDHEMARDAMIALVQGIVVTQLPTASEVEPEQEGTLLKFQSEQLEVTLREFPPTFTAGRVDGVQVTFTGDLAAAAEPEESAEDESN